MRSLAPCPETPNCVSTRSGDLSKRMPPLEFEGDGETVRRAILDLLEGTPRVRVAESRSDYVRAEFTTLVFRWVDDVEFLIDSESKRVDYRSASRVGRYDLGANRRRMKKLCRRLLRHSGIFAIAG